MARPMTLRICHLYPDLMDTYGDRGNITTIVKRCQWRGIKVTVSNVTVGDLLSTSDFDFYFFGGGQDRQQEIVARDLPKKSKAIISAVDGGAVLLSVCGGYQLLQKYFKTHEGKKLQGVGLFDAYTVASGDRMIQNLLVRINLQLLNQITNVYKQESVPSLSLRGAQRRGNLYTGKDRVVSLAMTNEFDQLIGFENHSGKTYLGKGVKPLGEVLYGAGNNGEDKSEGAVYKNAFGCYLHGSLLPKNVHFADFLIAKALERRYGIVKLRPLDDEIEWQAHQSASEISRKRT